MFSSGTAGKARGLVLRLATVLVALALGLAALEALLWLAPGAINPRLGNYVYTAYGNFPGGIYFSEETTRIHFLRSDFATSNYWNGYRWHHRADGWGFRNPPGTDPHGSILLLGDSLIYGHGVEEPDTVAHQLRRRYGRPAYNMARQGDCLYQSYVLLRLYLEPFEPRSVVLFVFLNDFADLLVYRRPEEIHEPPEIDRYDYQRLRETLRRHSRRPPYGSRQQLLRSRAVRLLRGLYQELAAAPWMARAEAAGRVGYLETILQEESFRLVSGYYRKVLADLAHRCRRRGVPLTLVFLELPAGEDVPKELAQERLGDFLGSVASAVEIPYFTTRGVFAGCSGCFLPQDGHFSPEGHRRLAAWLEETVLSEEM